MWYENHSSCYLKWVFIFPIVFISVRKNNILKPRKKIETVVKPGKIELFLNPKPQNQEKSKPFSNPNQQIRKILKPFFLFSKKYWNRKAGKNRIGFQTCNRQTEIFHIRFDTLIIKRASRDSTCANFVSIINGFSVRTFFYVTYLKWRNEIILNTFLMSFFSNVDLFEITSCRSMETTLVIIKHVSIIST